jgi:peptidoglycan/LPS O-acetylase OafA/YrhL
MAIFGMLLVAPFFARSFEHMDEKAARIFFGLFIGFSALNLVGVCLATGFGWPWPLAVFFTLFLLGPAVSRVKIEQGAMPVLVFVACVAITAILALNGVPYHPVNDNTPFYIIAGISLFIMLRGLGSHLKESRTIKAISKHSFGIYMCHLMAIPYLSAVIPQMTKPLLHAVLTALALAAAFGFAVLVDSFIIHPIQHLADKIFGAGKQA